MSSPLPLQNFREFKSYVSKFGFSISNFYDVDFVLTNNQLANQSNLGSILGKFFNNDNTVDKDTIKGLMRAYADECTIPGYQISTGEYRINNSPQFKYAYGIVNNEITFSFICDADSELRKTFDAWGNFIYTSSIPIASTLTNRNTINQLGRTRYRDEYVTDIIVIKYERYASSKKNSFIKLDTGTGSNISSFHLGSDIIPDYNQSIKNKDVSIFTSGFGKAIPTYSTRLINAFPTNISSMALSSGSSQLLKLQVTFEYETAVTSGQLQGSTLDSGTWQTIANN